MKKRRLINPDALSLRLAPILANSYISQGILAVDRETELVFQRIAARLKSLADPTRLAILHLLQEGEKRVTDILAKIGGSQANVSKHLGLLRQAGFVTCRREGVNVYYSIADNSVFRICQAICNGIERGVAEEREAIEKVRLMYGEGNGRG